MVRVVLECNGSPGAQPFYVVGYGEQPGGRMRIMRYTPVAERAEALRQLFLRDVTEAARLGAR